MKTTIPKVSEVTREWVLVDAAGKPAGRLAVEIARVLRGKHKRDFTPHIDQGDFVIVINAEKVKLTGKKSQTKAYDRYSYYPGGRKVIPIDTMMQRHPERVIQLAVRRMLPKNKLGRQMLKKLKVYAGPDHPHQAQNLEPLPG